MSVSVGPGEIALTVTPRGASSHDRARTNCSTAPLLPRYSDWSGKNIRVPPVERTIMRPPSRRRRAASLRVKKTPLALVAKIRSKSCSLQSVSGLTTMSAALATTMSSAPTARSASSKRRVASAGGHRCRRGPGRRREIPAPPGQRDDPQLERRKETESHDCPRREEERHCRGGGPEQVDQAEHGHEQGAREHERGRRAAVGGLSTDVGSGGAGQAVDEQERADRSAGYPRLLLEVRRQVGEGRELPAHHQ